MSVYNRAILLAGGVVAGLLVGGAGRARADAVTIGFLQRTMTAPYYVAMWKEAETLSHDKGFSLVASQAGGDPVKQMTQLEDITAKGVHVVVMNAADPVTEKTAVTEAIGKGLQVVFIDTAIPDVGADATFGADNEKIGMLAGEIAAKRLGAGPVKLGVLEGGPADKFVGPAREKGFLAGLAAGGTKYDIVVRGQANYAQDLAVPAAEDMLTAHPDLNMIFAYNDSMGLGALSALPAGSKVLISSVDGQKEALKAIHDGGCSGHYVSTGLNSPSLAARDGFTYALGLATGKKQPSHAQPVIFTKAAGIGCDNIADFYDPNSVF